MLRGVWSHRSWLLAVLLALLTLDCKPRPPVIVPTPPPVEEPTYPELRLVAQGTAFAFADGHAPFEFRKVIF